MPRPAGFNDLEIKNFSGLDLRGPGELLSERSLQTLTNFEIGDLGQIKTRPGFKRIHDGSVIGPSPVRFIGQHSTDTQNQIMVQSVIDSYGTLHGRGNLYVTNNTGSTWTAMSGGSNLSCGRSSQFGEANSNIPTLTGMYTWNGSALTGPVSGTKLSSYSGLFAQDRYFTIENSTGNIWFSDPGNAASYPGANTIGFTVDNKDNIVGILPYRDRVVIFFQNSIRVLYLNGPPSSWVMKFLPFYLGVMNQDCYYVYNDLIYFLSSEGFFRTDLTQLEELSKPIAPVFQKRWEAYQLESTTYNKKKYGDALGFWRGRFFISIRTIGKSGTFGGGVPTHRMFMYNVRNGAWAEIVPNISNADSMPFTPFTSFYSNYIGRKSTSGTGPYNKEGLYISLGDSTGRIYFFDDEDPVYYDGISNATNFNSIMKTKEIDGDLPSEYKRSHTVTIRTKKVLATSGTSTKLNVNGTDLSSLPIQPTTVPKQIKIRGPGYFRTFNLEVSDVSDQYLEIEGITVNLKKKQELPEVST
jgi:hypothetical protein